MIDQTNHERVPAQADLTNSVGAASPRPVQTSPRGSDDLAKMIRVVLNPFFSDPDPTVRSLEVASYLKSLGDVSLPELQAAWDDYQRSGPRQANGRLTKPVAHDLRARITNAREMASSRMRRYLPPPPEPEDDPPVTAAQAEAIMRKAYGGPQAVVNEPPKERWKPKRSADAIRAARAADPVITQTLAAVATVDKARAMAETDDE